MAKAHDLCMEHFGCVKFEVEGLENVPDSELRVERKGNKIR